ncbi:hypothetical protein PENTCL1PPCAC_9045, partial [Pristionchus entomophagus]
LIPQPSSPFIKMLRVACFFTVISLASAAILPRGFAVVAAPAKAEACVDTQSADICTPVTCNAMPSLGFDMCRKSCGWCELSAPPCTNAAADATCDAYKAANQCASPSVTANCAKSCGICTDTPAPPTPQDPSCKNAAADKTCDAYKAENQCGSASVIVNCKKSCGLC